ncbi:MAG: hypothetical protein IKB34_00690 [Clostridia bacterium]|nr:hypothetical protein [Clostridia bacterium]
MKKLLILMLVLCLAFTMIACDKDDTNPDDNPNVDNPNGDNQTHTVHTDEDADGKCDGCKSTFIDYDKPTVVGKLLKKSVEEQLKKAKSMKIKVELTDKSENKYWYEAEEGVYDSEEYKYESTVVVDITVAKTGSGFSAVLKVESTDVDYDDEGNRETDTDTDTVYIIDGVVYDSMDGTVYQEITLIPDELKSVLDELFSEEIMTETERNELLQSLGAEIATVINLRDYKGSWSIDLADSVNELLAYFAGLNMENDTVRKVVNDALDLVDEDLDIDDLVAELERIAGLTVEEAVAELDAWLTQNYDTTLQAIYDSIVNDDRLWTVMEQVIVAQNGLDPVEDRVDIDEAIAEAKAQAQAFKIADFLEEEGVGEVPLYDFVLMFAGAPEDAPTADDIFGMIDSILDMTLAEFEETFDIGIFSSLKEDSASMTFHKLNGKLDFNFEGLLSIKSIEGLFEISVEQKSEYYEGYENYNKAELTFKFTVSDIGETEVAIKLPDGVTTVPQQLVDGEFNSWDGDVNLDVDWYIDGEGKLCFYFFSIDIYDYDLGGYVELVPFESEIALDALMSDRIVIDRFMIIDPKNGEEMEVAEGEEFIFSLDAESDELIIIHMPEYQAKVTVSTLFREMIENGSVTAGEVSMDPRIVRMEAYDTISLETSDDMFIDKYVANYYYDAERDVMIFEIVGFIINSDKSAYTSDMSISFYGGVYDEAELLQYFDGDITFEMYLDTENNILVLDGLQDLPEKYRVK